MNLRRKIAVSVSALAVTIGGGILTIPPAAADEPCASGKLCLYRSTLYRTMEFSTGNVSNCWWLEQYNLGGPPWSGIKSYRNNLSVKATLWVSQQPGWNPVADASIAPGSVSSDTTGGNPVFAHSAKVCTGSAKPWE